MPRETWRIFAPLAERWFRAPRMRAFVEDFEITDDTTIVDLGGTPVLWRLLERLTKVRPKVTLVNLWRDCPYELPAHLSYLAADARQLPLPDRSVDIAFSNSTIEHLGTLADQCRFAAEVQRVGRRYYVQTPNFFFPVEPHLYGLGIHWLYQPLNRWHYALMRYASLTGYREKWTRSQCADWAREIHLLTARELRLLFPNAKILRERVGPFTKSLIAQA